MTSISQIQIPPRFRKAPGDIAGLAASIAEIGLLHPVVIAPDKTLIAGARRLFACKELGWEEIPTREIDLAPIIRGEHDENICRKDFTKSERVAIAAALRDFRHGGNRRSVQSDERHLETEEAARRAGFESRREFFRAAKVVEHGEPELIAAMDAGAISTEKAAEAAELPAEEQRKIAALPTPKEARQRARESGGHILASNGKWIDGRSKPEIDAEKARTAIIFQFIEAIEALATMPEEPAEYIARLPSYQAEQINRSLAKAEAWLGNFAQLWRPA